MPDIIAQSGDVHPNPGPKRMHKKNPIRNLIKIIFMSVFLISKIEQITNQQQQDKLSQINMRFRFEKSTLIFMISRKKEMNNSHYKYMKKVINNFHFLIIMLLLSGDIEQNPGPKISRHFCKEVITTS